MLNRDIWCALLSGEIIGTQTDMELQGFQTGASLLPYLQARPAPLPPNEKLFCSIFPSAGGPVLLSSNIQGEGGNVTQSWDLQFSYPLETSLGLKQAQPHS